MSAGSGRDEPLLTRHWGRALSVASLTAWSLLVLPVIALSFVNSADDPFVGQRTFNLLLLFGIFGIPVAFTASFMAGIPAILIADHFRLRKWWHAILVGAVAGLVIAVISVMLFRAYDIAFLPGVALGFSTIGAIAGLAAAGAFGQKLERHDNLPPR